MTSTLRISPATRVGGEIRPPSDKSLTHRAYIFAALAVPEIGGENESTIIGALEGEDCQRTKTIFELLGRDARTVEPGVVRVKAGGISLPSPASDLECGNSGTTMRLMCGVLASRPGLKATLVGDASLSRRPMKRVVDPLALMGAIITGTTAPLTIQGESLKAIDYQSPIASAQVKSCILLAGLRASGTTWVTEPEKSRDHTERMLTGLGVTLLFEGDKRVGIEAGQTWSPFHFEVPGDISSSAFWAVLAACFSSAQVTLQDVGVNPTRTGLLDVLKQTGADFEIVPKEERLGEPVADITIRGGSDLSAFEIGGDLVPRLIDEIPVLAVLATQCHGRTVIRDASELKVKESDRIALVADGLSRMGAKIEATDDGMIITGPTRLLGTEIDAHGDHRIAMAFAIAGMLGHGETVITGAETIATSYPNFEQDANTLADF